MTQTEKSQEIAEKTAEFLANGGEIERHDSDDQPDFRKVGFISDSSEVYT